MNYQTTPNSKVITTSEFWDVAYESGNTDPEKHIIFAMGEKIGYSYVTFTVGTRVYHLVAYHFYGDNGYLDHSEFVAWYTENVPSFEISADIVSAVRSIDSAIKYHTTLEDRIYIFAKYRGWEYCFRINSKHEEPNKITCSKI